MSAASITIEAGSTVQVVWADNSSSELTLEGTDAQGPIWRELDGTRHPGFSDRPYVKITVTRQP